MYWKQDESTAVTNMQVIHEGDGAIKTRALFDESLCLPIKVQIWELAPGVSEGGHTHEGDCPLEEIYYFLEGDGTMWMDDDDVPVAAGDAVLVPPEVDHGFRNTGSSPLKLMIIWGKPQD